MTPTEARRVFATLMQKARTGTLTERDRAQLTTARQMLRRGKRPAMNPKPKRVFDVLHSGGQTTRFYKLSDAKRFLKRHPDGTLDAHRIGERRGPVVSPAKGNPSGKLQRIGRAMEVRYRRDIGRKPGYYKHEIESRRAGVYTIPAGWVYVSTKSILITEGKPRV